MESRLSNDYKFISNIGDVISLKDFAENLRATSPSVTFDCECYHYGQVHLIRPPSMTQALQWGHRRGS